MTKKKNDEEKVAEDNREDVDGASLEIEDASDGKVSVPVAVKVNAGDEDTEDEDQQDEDQQDEDQQSEYSPSYSLPSPLTPSGHFASIHTIVLMGVTIIDVGFVGLFTWMSFAPLAEGVVASGRIVVDTNRKTVQHLEGGIVDEILIQDGDKVKQGDILITLDNKQIRARLNALEVRYFSSLAKLSRLRAEVAQADAIDYPEVLLKRKSEPRIREAIEIQEIAFGSRSDSVDGRRQILLAKINESKQRILGLEAERSTNIEVKEVIELELEDAESLLKKGLIEKPRVLDLRRRLTEVKGADARIVSAISSARINIGESELEIIQLQTNLRQDASREYRETSSSIFELEEQLASAEDIRNRIEIRAPRSGVIVGLSVHTKGGVIPPGSPILDIVPESDRLIIEAQVRPTDIDNVTPGMDVRVQLTAFQSRSTPVLTGTLERVTADTLQDPNNPTPFYLARVGVSEEELSRLDEGLFLVPGMPAEVLIQAGERTVLDYLIAPIQTVLSRGFKES